MLISTACLGCQLCPWLKIKRITLLVLLITLTSALLCESRSLCYLKQQPNIYDTQVHSCEYSFREIFGAKLALHLDDCRTANLNEIGSTRRCEDAITDQPPKLRACNYDFLLQDLNHFKVYINDSGNAECEPDKKTISLTLSSLTVNDDLNPDKPVFDFTFENDKYYTNKTVIYAISIYYSRINSPDQFSKLLATHFGGARYIEFKKTKVTAMMRTGFLDSKNFPMLRQLSFRDSSLYDMDTDAILLERRYELDNFEFINSEFTGRLELGSIVLRNYFCEKIFTFYFRNSRIRKAFLPARQPIVVDGKCATTSRTYFEFRDNDLDTMPERVFRIILSSAREFNYTSIDCCNGQNKWLLSNADRLTKELKFRKDTNIECTSRGSISGTIWTMESNLEQSCIDLANHAILTISIVLVLSLAALLALFSCYCIYYVLPRRNNVVMINSRGKHVNSTRSNSSTHSRFSPGNGRNISSKSTGLIEIQSTQTEGPHNQVPLMSTVGKAVLSEPGKKVLQLPAEQQNNQKALDMSAKLPKSLTHKSSLKVTRSKSSQSGARKSSPKLSTKSIVKSTSLKSATKFLQPRKSGSKLGAAKSTKSVKTISVIERPTKDTKTVGESSDRMSEAFKKDDINNG